MNLHQDHKLSVRLFGHKIGVLTQTPKGKLHFAYNEDCPYALSTSLPLKDKSYEHGRCFPYFAGLIPEGEKSLPFLSRILGVNQNDCFSLLKMMGMDCPGAVSFHQLEEPENEAAMTPLKGTVLSDKDLEKQLHTLPHAPLFFNTENVQVALSGSQYKAAICLVEGNVAIPEKGCFSTHIIKPAIAPFEEAVFNEYFCMRLGAKLGLSMAPVALHRGYRTNYLLITRFDREIQGNKIKHFHQEDFCQALSFLPSSKYQQEGGPSFKGCFGLLQKANIPAVDRIQMMKLIIFNYLISNYQAHAKDFAIKYLTPKQFQLAPFYDVRCTLLDTNTSRMAMKIGGIYTHNDMKTEHWRKFCANRGFAYPAFKQMFHQQMDSIVTIAKEEKSLLKEAGFDCQVAERVINVIQKNCKLAQDFF